MSAELDERMLSIYDRLGVSLDPAEFADDGSVEQYGIVTVRSDSFLFEDLAGCVGYLDDDSDEPEEDLVEELGDDAHLLVGYVYFDAPFMCPYRVVELEELRSAIPIEAENWKREVFEPLHMQRLQDGVGLEAHRFVRVQPSEEYAKALVDTQRKLRRANQKRQSNDGELYVIRLAKDVQNRVKVGFTSNLKGRVQSYITANPTLEVLGRFPCSRRDEHPVQRMVRGACLQKLGPEVYDVRDVVELCDAIGALLKKRNEVGVA